MEIWYYTQAIAINPQYANAYFHRGLFHEKQGKLPTAITDYNKARELCQAQGNTIMFQKVTEKIQRLKGK